MLQKIQTLKSDKIKILYICKREYTNIRRAIMSFLAVDAQKQLFILQRNQLQYEQTLVMNEANWVSKEMGYYANELGEDADLDNDPYYIELQQTEEYLESIQDTLDSQIQLLDNEISSLKTLVNNNIKNSCGLNLIGS